MHKDTNKTPQTTLYLRLFVGGYLLYLAWDLRTSIPDSPLFLIAVAVFGLAGAILAGSSLRALLRKDSEDSQ